MRAWRQTRDEAAESRQSHGRYVRASRDPTTKTVLFEDSAAVDRRRDGLRRRRAAPGHRRPALRRPGLDRHRRAPGRGRGRPRPRHQGAAHRRGGDARGAPGDHRDHRGAPGRRPPARAADDGAGARSAARRRAHRPGRRPQRRRDRAGLERPRPRAARAHCHGVAGLPGRDPAQRGGEGRGRQALSDATPERPPHRLACQKAISPASGAATTLRQPAGPSRASSRTAAPRSRARSVAAPISGTST